jgi:ribosome biogenesis GTPase A
MEPNDNEKIRVLLENTIDLLDKNEAKNWSLFLKKELSNFLVATDKKEGVSLIIRSLTSGAGSLSDLVLHKDGKPLIDENNRLYDLLNELYEECNKIK